MTQSIQITVNGKEQQAKVEPRTLLVDFLRSTLGLTGTHVGCDTSQCGACNVHVDGECVKSCTVFAVQADGSSVTTIEGMAGGGHYPPPGPFPGEDEIRHALEGNYCRCTGYHNIVKAIQRAAEAT